MKPGFNTTLNLVYFICYSRKEFFLIRFISLVKRDGNYYHAFDNLPVLKLIFDSKTTCKDKTLERNSVTFSEQ